MKNKQQPKIGDVIYWRWKNAVNKDWFYAKVVSMPNDDLIGLEASVTDKYNDVAPKVVLLSEIEWRVVEKELNWMLRRMRAAEKKGKKHAK